MRIGIVTAKRKRTNYLNGTLQSLRENTPELKSMRVTVYCGSSDTSHFDVSQVDAVECLPDVVLKSHGSQVNSTTNHAVATLHSNLIIEDDVEFVPGWLQQLRVALQEIRRLRPNGVFLASLFSSDNNWPVGANVLPYPIDQFYGSVATYVPDELQFVTFRHLVGRAANEPPDVAYASLCRENGIPLYLVTPFPVRHVGVESGIRGTNRTT